MPQSLTRVATKKKIKFIQINRYKFIELNEKHHSKKL